MINEFELLCILPTPIPQTHTDLQILAIPVPPAVFTLLELSSIGSVMVKDLSLFPS